MKTPSNLVRNDTLEPRHREPRTLSRRRFAAAAIGCIVPAAFAQTPARSGHAPPSTANEKLMREHGIVERVILIYRHAADLLEQGKPFDTDVVGDAARIVLRAIHGKHEPEEEQFLFPLVEKDAEAGELVATLVRQHAQGRALTALIGGNLTPQRRSDPQSVRQLIEAMRGFGTMYEAHAAYENSVIYPAFRDAESSSAYASVSARLRRDEQSIGERDDASGYSKTLWRIEKSLGLALDDYTSRLDVRR